MSRRKRRWALLLCLLAAGLGGYSTFWPSGHPARRSLAALEVTGKDGRVLKIGEFAGRAGLVLAFTGVDCPNSNKSLPRLAELARAYAMGGVRFLGVDSNAGDAADAVAAHAREHDIPFPVVRDPHQAVADFAGVGRTCEVVALDAEGVVRYRGAIDDRFGRMSVRAGATRDYLADALDAILAGRPVALPSTVAVGCPIDRARPAAPAARVRPAAPEIARALDEKEVDETRIPPGPITYSRDVAPIVQRKCQPCHRPGQEAPFSLRDSDDARRRAEGIAEVVRERRMPPWHADPRHGRFANDRSLSSRERATLLAWVERGAEAGEPADLPPPRSFAEGWSIGVPDAEFAIPEPNRVPAAGVLDYVIVTVPTHFARDVWVRAAEVRPEVRSVVHHIIVQILKPGGPADVGDHLATYVPGDAPIRYPPGVAKKIPAGARLKFGIHYTPDGVARVDRPRIGLVFATGPVTHEAFTHAVEDNRFAIPPHAPAHPVSATFTAPADLHVLSFSPHMHVRGKDFRYTAVYPDGRSEVLLSVPAYDFGWQSAYLLAEPKAIPRGTRIECLAHFDNSAANPANPDPSRRVEYGEQSYEEMMIGYLDYTLAAPAGRGRRPDLAATRGNP